MGVSLAAPGKACCIFALSVMMDLMAQVNGAIVYEGWHGEARQKMESTSRSGVCVTL